jgi:hypothetical protein
MPPPDLRTGQCPTIRTKRAHANCDHIMRFYITHYNTNTPRFSSSCTACCYPQEIPYDLLPGLKLDRKF